MMKKITLLIFFLMLSNSFAQSEEQNNLFYLNEITKHCVMEGSGSNVKRIGLGTGFRHRNINNEYSEINNCSELKLGYNNENWKEISALEFCEKYFEGTGKNGATKSLILTKYPECIISETPFKLKEFTKQELIENNLIKSLNYENNLLKIIEYIELEQNKILIKNNQIKKQENKKNTVSNKTVDAFTYCERSEVLLYYRISKRRCLETDNEISRSQFEVILKNSNEIICKTNNGNEECMNKYLIMNYSKENCTKHSNKKINYNEDDREVLLYCRGPLDKKNYLFKEGITAEVDINESDNSSEKVKVEINIDKVSLKKELKYWKELYDDELITKAEYDAKRKELLNQPITKTEVKRNNSNQIEKVIKEVSIDKSYQNKNYLYEKIDRKLFPMPTDRIFKNCNKDYRKILEQIKCSKDNLRATHRYKKRLKYFDIYELHVTTLDTIEDLILKGQLTEMQAKSNVASLNTQTINILDNRAELNRQKYERIGKLGQQLADPNYDITTGTYKNQNNNNDFQDQNNQPCMYNPATDDYQICLHKGAEQNSCFHFGNQCTP